MIRRASPTLRITIGLVSLTVSLLLVAQVLGFMPDSTVAALDARKKVCEALAAQLSWGASRNDVRLMENTLNALVERNEDILSAALRNSSGDIIAVAGSHDKHWEETENGRSTPTHVQVPLFAKSERWGVVQISFTPLQKVFGLAGLRNSANGLFLFVAFAGSIGFFIFLRRALRELDPSGVIPERVKGAFDALAEGVLIMDEDEHIVLANESFGLQVEQSAASLTGRDVSALDWRTWQAGDGAENLPWKKAVREGKRQTGMPLLLQIPSGAIRTFMVNGTPILDGKGKARGVLATFDDVTDVEKRNTDLQRTLKKLEQSKEAVNRQNKELRFLATRDSLTGCLNRRAFFERCEALYERARQSGKSLCCIMADIDHFKAINDEHGHAIGDRVIELVADILRAEVRDEDLVCRYGGEEFCVFLPGLELEKAVAVAERLRRTIRKDLAKRLTLPKKVTTSLGVACLQANTESVAALVNEADVALYAAKERGRDEVVRAGQELFHATTNDGTDNGSMGHNSSAAPTMNVDEANTDIELQRLRQQIQELETQIDEKSSEMEQRPGFDALTGLPNALLFNDRVNQSIASAKRTKSVAGILYVDIDVYRSVNDALGHEVGDALLKAVAERMTSVLRQSDTVALLGGGQRPPLVSRLMNDEFGVALAGLTDVGSVTWIIQRMFDCLSDPVQIAGHEIYLTCSIGASLYPHDGDNAKMLLRQASAARVHARNRPGQNNFSFYAKGMNEQAYQRLKLDAQMRHAIENDEFSVNFQPKVNLRTGKINAMEALIRWRHPEMGQVDPKVFIEVAECTGFIETIGDWVMQNACHQAKVWADDGVEGIRVAVNISVVQLCSERFSDRLMEILEDIGIEPQLLELEITETAVMENIETAARRLRELRGLGIHISIDDFGTGYSSLAYLKRFAADVLKIDSAFVADMVTDPNDAALVAGIIAMAHRMGLKVVAEGVETEDQLSYLRSMQCDEVQGYFLSRPLPVAEARALLQSGLQLTPPASSELDGRRPVTRSADSKKEQADKVANLSRL